MGVGPCDALLHSPVASWKRPVDQAGRLSGGEPVWILPVAQTCGQNPDEARPLAAGHLTRSARSMTQFGPPPFPCTPMKPQATAMREPFFGPPDRRALLPNARKTRTGGLH